MSDERDHAFGSRGAGHRAVRSKVPPVLIRSSMIGGSARHIAREQIAGNNSRTAMLSPRPLPIGRLSATSRASRSNSARFMPPASGETTASFASANCFSHNQRTMGCL